MSTDAVPLEACNAAHARLTIAAEALRAVCSTLRGNLSVHKCMDTLSFHQIDAFLQSCASLSITHPIGEPFVGSVDDALVVSMRIGTRYAHVQKRPRNDNDDEARAHRTDACVRIGRTMRAATSALRDVRVLRNVCLQPSEPCQTVVWCRMAGGVPVALRMLKLAYAEEWRDGMLVACQRSVPLPIRVPTHDDGHMEEPMLHCFASVRNPTELTSTTASSQTGWETDEPSAKRPRA